METHLSHAIPLMEEHAYKHTPSALLQKPPVFVHTFVKMKGSKVPPLTPSGMGFLDPSLSQSQAFAYPNSFPISKAYKEKEETALTRKVHAVKCSQISSTLNPYPLPDLYTLALLNNPLAVVFSFL